MATSDVTKVLPRMPDSLEELSEASMETSCFASSSSELSRSANESC